jgi:antitoxin CptB
MTNVLVLDKGLARWRSRRGMKELDIFLVDFVEQYYDVIPEEQKIIYAKMLDEEDQDLWLWFLGIEEPDYDPYRVLIASIQAMYRF